ncbi:MAG: hypothetical protein ACRDJE_14245 [Dehalococcoidia bacterium]
MTTGRSQGEEAEPAHVVYDRVTGRVLGRYRLLDAATGAFREADQEEVLALFKDQKTLARLTEADPANLGAAAARVEPGARLASLRVSPASGAIENRPRIRLHTDRDALEGDGEDSVTLSIDVIGERDAVIGDYSGEIKVSTTHGKLSARAGLIKAEKGRAALTLTSTRETIDEVRVRAVAPDGTAQPAETVLRFE